MFDNEATKIYLRKTVIGKVDKTTKTIMHGVCFVASDKPLRYAYLKVSLQKMEAFENIPIAERGLGAVSGGFVWSANATNKGKDITGAYTNEQEWGVIDASKAHHLCGFYNPELTKYYRVMVCFDKFNVAPVSGFWRNENVLVGPNTKCEKKAWGKNFKSFPDTGSYAIALEKGKLYIRSLRGCRCFAQD